MVRGDNGAGEGGLELTFSFGIFRFKFGFTRVDVFVIIISSAEFCFGKICGGVEPIMRRSVRVSFLIFFEIFGVLIESIYIKVRTPDRIKLFVNCLWR